MNTVKALYEKYKDLIPYIIFGVLTTLINWVAYKLTYGVMHLSNVLSTCLAWLIAVLFAFITNKLFVFDSKTFEKHIVIKEAAAFFSARILTGAMDIAVMYFAVDVYHLHADLWKMLSNIIVIVANYVFSKFWIFKKS